MTAAKSKQKYRLDPDVDAELHQYAVLDQPKGQSLSKTRIVNDAIMEWLNTHKRSAKPQETSTCIQKDIAPQLRSGIVNSVDLAHVLGENESPADLLSAFRSISDGMIRAMKDLGTQISILEHRLEREAVEPSLETVSVERKQEDASVAEEIKRLTGGPSHPNPRRKRGKERAS